MFVRIINYNNQAYVTDVPSESPALACKDVRDKIVNGEPIACDIIHDNNRAPMTVIFHGPVTIQASTEVTV